MTIYIFLIFALISYSNCEKIITEIEIDSSNMTTLNTTLNFTTYFFMTLSKTDIAGDLYFHITDKDYELNFDDLKICITTDDPKEDSTLSECDWEKLKPYEKTDSDPKHYFYKYRFSPDIRSRNFIVEYSGKNSTGELEVESSLTDIFEKIKDLIDDVADTALSVLAIIGIVIGSFIGFCFLLAFIAAILSCCKQKDSTFEEPNSKAEIEIPDKPILPLDAQTSETSEEIQNE